MNQSKPISKRVIKSLIIVAAVVLVLGAIVPICLAVVATPRVTNRLLAHYVPQFLRADVQVAKLNLSIFSTYPDVEVELQRPIVRVAVPDSINLAGRYQAFPHGDTLLAADTIRVRMQPLELLANRVHIRSV